MTSELSKDWSPSSTPGRGRPQSPQRLYVFVVMALVIFLVGLILFKPPIRGYVVTAELGCEAGEIPSRAEVAQSGERSERVSKRDSVSGIGTTASLDSIRRAVRRVSQRTAPPTVNVSKLPIEQLARQVQRRLIVRLGKGAKNQTTVTLRYQGPHPEWSIAVLNELASEFLAPRLAKGGELLSTRELREARWHVELTNHYQYKAWLELQSLLMADTALLLPGSTSGGASPELAADSGRDVDGSATPNRKVNPQWEKLQTRLADLTSQLDILLKQDTPNYPIVRRTSQQIQDVHQQLRRVPVYLESEPGENAHSDSNQQLADSKEQSPRQRAATSTPEVNRRQAELISALAECRRTRTARMQAEANMWSLIDQQMAGGRLKQLSSRWLIEPARITGRFGGAPSAVMILSLGMAGLLGGLVMAWLTGTLRDLRNLSTVEDVKQWVPVPIVCQLSLNSTGSHIQRLIMRGRLIRWTTMAGELALGLMLLTFVFGSLAGTSISGHFSQDPLGTFAETIVQVWQ